MGEDCLDFMCTEPIEPLIKNTEIMIAIIGVIGTLAGTILGWGLNSLSQRGKLNFYVHSWKEEFQVNKIGEMVLALVLRNRGLRI